MGVIIDTTVLIGIERKRIRHGSTLPVGDVIADGLENIAGLDGTIAIAAITASELLHGVHRADNEHRARREAFVEAVLAAVDVVAFDLVIARTHARLWADLSSLGVDVGAHDRLVAATALRLGWSVATANVRHFERVPDLDVIAVT